MLDRFSQQFQKDFVIECEEWDICRDPTQDLLREDVQQKLLERIRGGEFIAVLMSPPCASWQLVSGALGKSMGPKAVEDVHAPVGHALAGGS